MFNKEFLIGREAPQVARELLGRAGIDTELALIAQQAVRLGGRQLLRFHGKSPEELKVKIKSDDTVQTVADRESERRIRRLLGAHLPNIRIWGEEEGITGNLRSTMSVYLDPLDGSGAFEQGEKVSTLGMAIDEFGETIVSAIGLPFSRELIVAVKGKGTHLFGLRANLTLDGSHRKLSVASTKEFIKSVVYCDPNLYPLTTTDRKTEFLRRLSHNQSPKSIRLVTDGTNIGNQARIADAFGKIRVLCLTDHTGNPADHRPGSFAINEAGGWSFDFEGNRPKPESQAVLMGNPFYVEQNMPDFIDCFRDFKGFAPEKK